MSRCPERSVTNSRITERMRAELQYVLTAAKNLDEGYYD